MKRHPGIHMHKSLLAGSRPWALSASCLGMVTLLATASHLGCEPAEMGSVDMARSKSIAAETGIEEKRAGGSMRGNAKARSRHTQAVEAKGFSTLPRR